MIFIPCLILIPMWYPIIFVALPNEMISSYHFILFILNEMKWWVPNESNSGWCGDGTGKGMIKQSFCTCCRNWAMELVIPMPIEEYSLWHLALARIWLVSRSSAAQGRTVGHGLLAARVRMVSDRRIARQTFHQAKERKLVTSWWDFHCMIWTLFF
jgi:hypothetical protein